MNQAEADEKHQYARDIFAARANDADSADRDSNTNETRAGQQNLASARVYSGMRYCA